MITFARTFVVALALTGAAAAAHNTAVSRLNSTAIIGAKATAFPIPTCPPDDPNGCGILGPGPTAQE